MKYLLFFFAMMLSLHSCTVENMPEYSQIIKNSQETNVVAKINKSGDVQFIDKANVKRNWENFLQEKARLNLNFNELRIDKRGEKYFLIGKDVTNKSTSMNELEVSGVFLRYNNCTVTCSGCESTGSVGECEPNGSNTGGYYCSSCSLGTCIKSTTCSDHH